ncbi:hypothetical protein SSX86_028152 [Deinandra increscens subsp. villosa]|uniref:Uncharacterized protein n=1 Tax=Deinandra increscens subsp. villosa TaxID=3103831 RepID=A0AAP0GL26_9ASTR
MVNLKSLVGASVTSSGILGPCIITDHISDHPAVSINQAEQSLTNQDYMEKIMEVNDKLDMVKNIVKPGCSYEVLNTALRYMSSLSTSLSKTPQRLHASL